MWWRICAARSLEKHLSYTPAKEPRRRARPSRFSQRAVTALVDWLEARGHVERVPNPRDRRSALVRHTEAGMKDSLEHLWPYIVEMRGIQESFSEEERAVIARFLIVATEATHRHAEEASSRP